MSSPQAILNKILPYSVVDGPGNRLVLFFQGCNFNCVACHNPYTIGVCDHCGECVPACHADALKMISGKVLFDPASCDQCDKCLEICPINASPMVAQYSVDQVLDIIRKHQVFLSGITVSGGEATLQLKFVTALFAAIKADASFDGITCFIDTNGHLGEKSWANLLPVIDGVMLDIKAFSNELHHELSGQSNCKTLAAAKIAHDAGKLHELRLLLVPGKNDTEHEAEAAVEFVRALDPNLRIKLNAFQHHGVKGEGLGWPSMQATGIEAFANRLRKGGIENIIVPEIYQ